MKKSQAAVPTNSFLGKRIAKKKMLVKAPAKLPIMVQMPAIIPIDPEKAQCDGVTVDFLLSHQ